jgi:hypothetical protein
MPRSARIFSCEYLMPRRRLLGRFEELSIKKPLPVV